MFSNIFSINVIAVLKPGRWVSLQPSKENREAAAQRSAFCYKSTFCLVFSLDSFFKKKKKNQRIISETG